MLELRDLRKIYQTKTRRVAALDGVSFALPEKGFVFILGRSGSGKTTTAHLLEQLLDDVVIGHTPNDRDVLLRRLTRMKTQKSKQ